MGHMEMDDQGDTGHRRRSLLYLPASNSRALEKAKTLAADVVILDLEDAVAPDRKAEARHAAAAALENGGFAEREVVVRVNAVGTAEFEADAAAFAAIACPILLPKLNAAETVRLAQDALGERPFWGMIETCRGMLDVGRIAEDAASVGLDAFVLGANDLAKEMGCRLDSGRQPIWGAMTTLVLAARANGCAVFDSVYNAISDAEGFAAECREGATFGFDGKTLIHPAQIDICNAAFSPSEAETAFAGRIVEAFADPANAGINALSIDGRMVERLHLAGARRTLARAHVASNPAGGDSREQAREGTNAS